MNFYSFHLGDYAAHTKHLSLMEDLAYRRMLDLYYTSEKPLPLEIDKIARLIGMRDHIEEISNVVSDFFLKSEDGYRSKRCDEEIAGYHAKAERAKNANKSRWKSDPSLKSDTKSDLKKGSDLIPTNNQEPITNNHKKEKEGTPDKPARFDPLTVALPNGLPAEKWREWIEYRRKRKLSNAEPTMHKQAAFLETCIASGHSAAAIIDASITNGWQGLFEPKANTGQARTKSKMNDMGLEMTAEEFTQSYEDQGFRVARP